MQRRKAVPRKVERALYQEAGNRCLICGLDDVLVLVVHHIVPVKLNPEHNPKDMIVLCRNCHDKADQGQIDREALWQAKLRQSLARGDESSRNVVSRTVVGDGNLVGDRISIVGDLNIHLPKGARAGSQYVVRGTVAENPFMRGYLKHLIDRYNELKKWERDTTQKKMVYSRIYAAYKREMKYDWKHTPQRLFPRAVTYLHKRIENTKIGRIRKKEGQKLYRTFEEFQAESADLCAPAAPRRSQPRRAPSRPTHRRAPRRASPRRGASASRHTCARTP
jgi:hypothetical protein